VIKNSFFWLFLLHFVLCLAKNTQTPKMGGGVFKNQTPIFVVQKLFNSLLCPKALSFFYPLFRTQIREFLGLFFNISKSYTYEPKSIFYDYNFILFFFHSDRSRPASKQHLSNGNYANRSTGFL